MAFAKQKVGEVATLARGLGQGREAIAGELDANDRALEDRRNSHRTRNPAVRDRVAALGDDDARRSNQFEVRREAQRARLELPLFPTTTIGSYPQTAEIRQARAELRAGDIDRATYDRRMRAEIERVIGFQEQVGLDVLVHGESIPAMTDDELFDVRKKFGLLFQDGALFGSMNIYDNTAFPLRQHTDKSEEEIGEIVNRRLKEVGLIEAIYKMPNELSGGMRKRAGFARALVLEPAIVMFDEPDSGLDPVRTALLCELIREVHAENGGCYLVISHDLNTARRIADFIAVLWNGKIVESGPKEELFDSENQFVHQFLNADVTGPLSMD